MKKFADEYLYCKGCGKFIPNEPFVKEGKRYCSQECYGLIKDYEEKQKVASRKGKITLTRFNDDNLIV